MRIKRVFSLVAVILIILSINFISASTSILLYVNYSELGYIKNNSNSYSVKFPKTPFNNINSVGSRRSSKTTKNSVNENNNMNSDLDKCTCKSESEKDIFGFEKNNIFYSVLFVIQGGIIK